MNLFLIMLAVIVCSILAFAIYRFYKVNKQSSDLYQQRFERIQPLYEKLENGEAITSEEVRPYADNLLTRKTAFQMLAEHNKTDLFPKEFNTIIKGAESDLSNWLEFPTELGSCPDEIEHVEEVVFNIENENVIYHVFKYRKNDLAGISTNSWSLGVVGPYFDDSQPYDNTVATFSRMTSKFGETEPEAEALWVHKNIAIRRL